MENERIESLTKVLKKLNTQGITAEVREEAIEIVKNINPIELSIAEQNLIEEGMDPKDLRHLCDIHMEVLKDELNKIKRKIKPGHVLYTMIAEHDEILGFLTGLEELNMGIQSMDNYDPKNEKFKDLIALANNILDAEKHHQREEDVLFVEMEKRKITGPTRIMKMEHEDLRAKKRELKKLATSVEHLNFDNFKERLDEIAKYIIFNLRDHIFKENYILYPSALEVIIEESVWDNMKERCDGIGYCGFTPLTKE
ncbi:DUF438 domain-containing protein [Clostridium amazonitimonense]|uniref:DUF438 domain-containing protein n=1 Tax=Clostridium amazonitimonense TaxID=1499689 RepID=UPI000509BA83|nr:DUF438 domain-containing protein [Clostridium amazonitimonense]